MKKTLLILIAFIIAGCMATGSAMLIGGKVVKDYKPSKIMVTYKALGNIPEGTQFFLIEVKNQLAMYQKDSDGTGMIFRKHWVEGDKDFFSAAYFGYGSAYIFFIPKDRSEEGGLFTYVHGSYQGTPGDRLRPMPNNPKTEPDIRLIPQL